MVRIKLVVALLFVQVDQALPCCLVVVLDAAGRQVGFLCLIRLSQFIERQS
jgi:hypothetical protein